MAQALKIDGKRLRGNEYGVQPIMPSAQVEEEREGNELNTKTMAKIDFHPKRGSAADIGEKRYIIPIKESKFITGIYNL